MSKALSIMVVLMVAVVAVSGAQAGTPLGQRIIAQEKAKGVDLRPTPQTTVQGIIAQERGRHADLRLFGPANAAPVQVVGPPDGFDVGDAGIGAATALALALLAAAGIAVRNGNRRRGTPEAVSAGS